MSVSNINLPSTRSIFAVDTRTGPRKVLFLPAASTVTGRYITVKDFFGFSGSSSFTVSTVGLDRIDTYNSSILLSTSFQSFSFLSGGNTSWQTLANQTGPVTLTFSPLDIATPEIWFDASYLPSLSFDPANCNVRSWSNRGSIAVSADSNAVLNPPKMLQRTLNGLNVLSYNNSNTLKIDAMVFATAERTLFCVFKQNELTTAKAAITFLQANNGYNFSDFSFLVGYDGGAGGSNLIGTVNGGYCLPILANFPQALDAFTFFSGRATYSDTGQQGWWQNGSNLNNTFFCPSESSGNTYPFYVGGGIQDMSAKYELAEIIIYQTLLSDTDRQRIEGYLAWKWGLRNLLPANHPYKNASP